MATLATSIDAKGGWTDDNEKSIKMINTYYKRDFEYFNYEMIDFK